MCPAFQEQTGAPCQIGVSHLRDAARPQPGNPEADALRLQAKRARRRRAKQRRKEHGGMTLPEDDYRTLKAICGERLPEAVEIIRRLARGVIGAVADALKKPRHGVRHPPPG